MPETVSLSVDSRRFGDLRGVQWRIDLGILPSSPSASIDDLRRVNANARRRYAALRRQLLVDPHVPKDGSNSPDLVIDNPLSQNPDSMWGRFFRNAELERMVDQDLTRLYPERGSYFQTSGCQGMLRRILLLWCLSHPEYGYRQGMHELLAPLLYVLNVDIKRLSEVREAYEDHFVDKFDAFSFHENDFTYKFDFTEIEKKSTKASKPAEVDPQIQTIILLSDAYGAEGELGVLLSEKFMEHDAYTMFDALMSGSGGVVIMAEFFSPSPYRSSQTMFPPVIEASAAMYHLLSIVDSSLHSHLVELGVEPQYFSLRWLRVLFGREFSLEDLLAIWDEIFSCDNTKTVKAGDSDDAEPNSGVLDSPRGAFISAFAVSMILHLRSSLLATENATACLKRLLNFPDDVKLSKLVEKAKALQTLAINVNSSSSFLVHPVLHDGKKSFVNRGHTLSLDGMSPTTPLNVVPESYWEEKWRDLNKKEEHREAKAPSIRKGWSERVRLRLSRTESDPSPVITNGRTNPSVRRSLLDDLSRQLGEENEDCNENHNSVDVNGENSPHFSISPRSAHGDSYQENEWENSSVASNSSVVESCQTSTTPQCPPPPLPPSKSIQTDNLTAKSAPSSPHPPLPPSKSIKSDKTAKSASSSPHPPLPPSKSTQQMGKSASSLKDRRSLSGKFQWLFKLGRNGNEGTSERVGTSEVVKDSINGSEHHNNVAGISTADGCEVSSGTSKGETVDQNLMVSLRHLGQSMLENIQVIESVFQQDRGQTGGPENMTKNGFVGKGQVTAVAALKELRKISNILSEM